MRRFAVTALAAAALAGCGTSGLAPTAAPGPAPRTLLVRLLDVGQGDAILIENGASRVLVDGGPNSGAFGRVLDALNLNGTRLQAVILTHAHADHYNGLRALFNSSRRIAIDAFYENQDTSGSSSMLELRDSVSARVARGETVLRDTDDPCGTGAAVCTITLDGGARLELLRPAPGRWDNQNNRSIAIKLLGPDSASFSLWLAGDAETGEIAYFDAADYDEHPGMRARLLKANHHGSCNGVTARYLDLVRPEAVIMSLSATNGSGFAHAQTLTLLRERGIRWYRTDVNGTITIRTGDTPGGGYSIAAERGDVSQTGTSDRLSTQSQCRAP